MNEWRTAVTGRGDPASRCGLRLRGIEQPGRDAGSSGVAQAKCPANPLAEATGSLDEGTDGDATNAPVVLLWRWRTDYFTPEATASPGRLLRVRGPAQDAAFASMPDLDAEGPRRLHIVWSRDVAWSKTITGDSLPI